jgi:ribosomal protein S18 acetylase RimI-like enzyme
VEAFAGSDERVAPFDEWLPWVTGDPSYDPALVFVAVAGDAVAGVAQCWTEGFVKDLAVRPAFRGRGLGEALLHAVFAEFARRGVREVRLKVDADNPTGAVRLYERVGMRELRRHAVYARG